MLTSLSRRLVIFQLIVFHISNIFLQSFASKPRVFVSVKYTRSTKPNDAMYLWLENVRQLWRIWSVLKGILALWWKTPRCSCGKWRKMSEKLYYWWKQTNKQKNLTLPHFGSPETQLTKTFLTQLRSVSCLTCLMQSFLVKGSAVRCLTQLVLQIKHYFLVHRTGSHSLEMGVNLISQ